MKRATKSGKRQKPATVVAKDRSGKEELLIVYWLFSEHLLSINQGKKEKEGRM